MGAMGWGLVGVARYLILGVNPRVGWRFGVLRLGVLVHWLFILGIKNSVLFSFLIFQLTFVFFNFYSIPNSILFLAFFFNFA